MNQGTFSINVRQNNDIWIFDTHGYINNEGGSAIAAKYKDAFGQGAKKYLFDLADSKIVNSIGVSILIEILEQTLEANGKFGFCNCAPIVAKTLRIMGLTQYAGVYDTVESALAEMK